MRSGGKAGDKQCSDRLRTAGRPGRHWPCCQSGATGLEHHRGIQPRDRSCHQTSPVPGLRRLAIMGNVDNPASVLDMAKVHAAARTLGLDAAIFEIRGAEDLVPTFEALKVRMDALYIPPDALINTQRILINTLALGARLPTMYGAREYVEAGGFMSYGPSFSDQFRRAANYVDKILRGAKPGDI